jgi:hypothetical protein
VTHEDFDRILEDRIAKTRAVLSSKSREYATGKDRLHNFHGAEQFGASAAEACWGYMMKHLLSVKDLAFSGKTVPRAVVDEKVGDAINYLILMEAILLEARYVRDA